MFHRSNDSVKIPNIEELRGIVVSRRARVEPGDGAPCKPPSPGAPSPPRADRTIPLSPDASRFLRHAAEPHHRSLSLEQRWATLGIQSGSVKDRVLNELRSQGFMRLERKGRSCQVHLYKRAYEFLGLPPPAGEGVGGTTHHIVVRYVAGLFKSKRYEVHIERALGAAKKRVDVVGYGTHHIIGVEIGLSDERQEIKNLREDWETGVLDILLFVTTDASILENVKSRVEKDPVLSKHTDRIHFLLIDEEEIS